MAVNETQQATKSISSDPEGPRVLKNQVSWAEQPCTPTSTSSTYRSSWFERLRSVVQMEPDAKNSRKLPTPCLLKIVQLFVSVVTAGLYTQGSKEVVNSVTTLMFPYLVALDYLIVTSVILLSYFIGHKMPDILVRIFNMLAVVLFTTAGAICIQDWHIHSLSYKGRLNDQPSDDIENDEPCSQNLTLDESYKCGIMLFATGLCCFINTIFYAGDIVYSLHTTLARA